MKLELNAEELGILANAIHDAKYADCDLTKIKNKRIRVIFEYEIESRHKLWLKIVHALDKEVYV